MKHVTPYSVFESEEQEPIRKVFTREQLNWLDRSTVGPWKYNPQTGKVDVHGNVYISRQGLSDFKGVEFGSVTGAFDCSENQLASLEGAPEYVGGNFNCNKNRLTTLEGGPKDVWGIFECSHNLLTSLIGAPEKIGGNLYCKYNNLTSVEGAPVASMRNKNRVVCSYNPVSDFTFGPILDLMKSGQTYLQAVESYWNRISPEEKSLMYRDNFSWVSAEELRKLDALKTYSNIKGML